jgi:AraC-like DNA-binding protein
MHPPTRHLLRARDTIDARYREQLDVRYLAQVAHASPAHFIREFKRAFGETPHQYLLTRRLERAAALLSSTDHAVLDICLEVGLQSLGSFTSSFKRTYGLTPIEYRAAYPPADVYIPTCYWMTAARPHGKAFLEKTPREPALSVASNDGEDRR